MRKMSWLLVVMMLLLVAGCATEPAAEEPEVEEPAEGEEEPVEETPVRVAIAFPGSIKDMGWSQSGHEALMEAKSKYNLEVSFQETVSNAEVKDVLRNYASDGYDLVIAHELYFSDPTLEVAPEFPDTQFAVTYGYQGAENVAGFTGTNWESTYLAGVLGGLVSETGTIGILTATDSPVALRMYNGFKMGALRANPDVQVIHAYVGSWDDVVKGKELVRSMVGEGADIIYTQCGQVNVGAVEAAAEAGIMAIGSMVDMTDVDPQTVIASAVSPPGAYVTMAIETFLSNEMEGKSYVLGVKDGAEDLVYNPFFEEQFSKEILDTVQLEKERLIQGEVEEPTA